MYDNRSFDRKFIVLTQESSGYELDGHKLAGNAVLELRNGKGRITTNVQGLKQIINAIYKVYLICSNDKETIGISAGVIEPGPKGKTSASLSFDPNGMFGSNISYSDISIVAIMVRSINQSQNEIIAPLVGYTNGVVIWKSGFKEWKISQDEISHAVEESVKISADHYDATEPEIEYAEAKENEEPPLTEMIKGLDSNCAETLDDEQLNDTVALKTNGNTQIEDEPTEINGTNDEITPFEDDVEQYAQIVDTEISPPSGVMQYKEDDAICENYGADEVTCDSIEQDDYKKSKCIEEAEYSNSEGFSNTIIPMMFYKYKELIKAPFKAVETDESEILLSNVTETANKPANEPDKAIPTDNHDSMFREKLREFVDNSSIDANMDENIDLKSVMPSDMINDLYNEHDIEELFNSRPKMTPFAPHANMPYNQEAYITGRHKDANKPSIPYHQIKWIRITQKDLYRLPRPIWKLANNPFVLLPYKRYNHYLLGTITHGKITTFYFCVPGQYSMKDKYRANLLGFTEFLVIDGGPPKEGVFGYWVMIV